MSRVIKPGSINSPADCRAAGAGFAGSRLGGCLATAGSNSCSHSLAGVRVGDGLQTWHKGVQRMARSFTIPWHETPKVDNILLYYYCTHRAHNPFESLRFYSTFLFLGLIFQILELITLKFVKTCTPHCSNSLTPLDGAIRETEGSMKNNFHFITLKTSTFVGM